ncbi:MAG: glycoside hydrolase family 3 C-terminal domain-containing protein [Oscillospiraceae bacterium]|nr:glycoside hydrolase family 3 C-terminal domain-containing protein [Oscillospiraceae bacterium]MBR2896623.1 glycoside hydrolase family 3 C-terminal domain-containing protein [Oscillospiraceae bacterium]
MREYWQRANYLPVRPLGEGGRLATGSPEHLALAQKIAEEGIVLAKNNGVLPLARGAKIAVFGKAQTDQVMVGTGSGTVRTASEVTVLDGLRACEQAGDIELFAPLSAYYEDFVQRQRDAVTEKTELSLKQLGKTAPAKGEDAKVMCGKWAESDVPEALLRDAAAFTDTALYVICRTAGEYADRFDEPGDVRLSAQEAAHIAALEKSFRKVVIVVNSGGMIEAGWMRRDTIGAVLFVYTPGMMGGAAIANILCGKVNPSGKLADTVAAELEDYPSTAAYLASDDYSDYEEDIFVGYRYFETIPGAAEKVVFPFGFGLSYTTFALETLEASEENGEITVRVRVKNTGKLPGKEVVQLYHGAPQGKLGKAAKSLAAFQKTTLLAPGAEEELTLRFAVKDMASYDDEGVRQKSAFLLEQGEYPVYVGTSVRDVTQCFTYTVSEAFRVTEQLAERCAPCFLPRKLQADGTYLQLPIRIPQAQKFDPPAAITEEKPAVTAKLCEVAEGKLSLNSFVKQLSDAELLRLLGGVDNTGCCQTFGFGDMEKYGIPAIMTSDGPAGVRTKKESGVLTTAFPGESLVASSWDPKLAYEMGEAIADEIKENNMYAWLAPALNIHRNPLCGRNYEYYSEDPLLSGKFAAEAVLGCQSRRISACPKHLACNNKENNRKDCDSRVSERALREIYLRGFRIAVEEGKPKMLMSSYNLLNGVRAGESFDLLTEILRGEWGFDGVVVTDWSNHGNHTMETKAGGDLRMPVGNRDLLTRCLRENYLKRGDVERAVKNILRLILWYEEADI